MKIYRLFTILLLGAAFLIAPRARAEYFRHLTLADGLSQPSVMTISQDALGRMWLGTREGINIFDGASVTSYRGHIVDPASGEKIWIGNWVTALENDAAGNMFMLIDNKIMKYDLRAGRFTPFTGDEHIYAMTESEGDIIFIADKSIMIKDGKTDSLRFQFAIPEVKGISHLAADSASYYISTSDGLHIFDRTTRAHTHLLPGVKIYSVLPGRDGTLWISATDGGLLAKSSNDSEPHLASMPTAPDGVTGAHQTRFAIEDHDGRIWYGTFTGLFRYNPVTGQTRHIQIPTNIGGLSHSSVFGMYCDRSGNIWAGTYYGGVNYFSPTRERFVNFNYESLVPSGLYHSFIIAILKDRDGRLWFGTDGAGVSSVDSDWNITRHLSTRSGTTALRQNNIKALAYDSISNRLFIGTHMGGLSIYDIDRGTMRNLIDEPAGENYPGNVIHNLKIHGANLYVTSNSGLVRMDLSNDRFYPIPYRGTPQLLEIDDDGTLYYANTEGIRLYRIRQPESQKPEVEEVGKTGDLAAISTICCVPGGVYVATKGDGIYFFADGADGQPQPVNTANSDLPDDYCYNIKRGNNDDIYLLTPRHIARMQLADRKFTSVAIADFFPEAHIIESCAILPMTDGDIFVGNTKGITMLSTDIFTDPSFGTDAQGENRREIFFSSLEVDNRPVAPSDDSGILDTALPYASRITLPFNSPGFTIRLGMSDYTTSTGSHAVEYRLNGSDPSGRHFVSENGEIHYNKLDPGSYRLVARPVGGDSGDEISIDIVVRRPWYSSFWAWLFYLLVAATLGYIIVRKSLEAARFKSSLRKEKIERGQIEKLNKEKLVFFTNVSHEFQTPLTLIMSHIDLLVAKYKRHEGLIDSLGRIRYQAHQMSHLITQLLEFRKLQQNYQILRIGRCDAGESLSHTALPFVDYAAKRDIDFSIDIPQPAPEGFYDAALIDRVLVNIISNAFKYTPDGGTIACSVFSADEGRVVFRISDSGKGIAQKDLPYIFDRFYNGNSDEQKRYNMDYRSTGIGLAFAKSIVDKHHGTISVESHEGEGATFTVILPNTADPYANDTNVIIESAPIHTASTAADGGQELLRPIAAKTESGEAEASDSRPSILIVEDNAELRHNLTAFFSNYFRVVEAADGVEGLEKAREDNPDLIISDVMMPRMDGIEMCRTIKGDINLCHIPVILLTALSASESQLEGLNANADDYITKPFESTLLLARVDNLIRNRRMLRGQFDRRPVSEIDLSVVNPLDRDLLRHSSAIIDKHIDDPDLDIAILCRELGVSRSLFFTKFKALTGMTPNAFIINYRLKHAAALLTSQPSLSVADIAYQSGFSNPAYFGRCFRKQFGVSPQQYRKGETTDNPDQ